MPAEGSGRSRVTAGVVRWLTPVIAAVFALVGGEILLRTVFHAAPQVDLDLYQRDDAGNLRLRPNFDRRHITPLWDVSVHTNGQGWRDESLDAAPVLGLGDSFAFGWGVEESEALYRLLEDGLGVTIGNAAIPGTSSGDQAKLLETYFAEFRPQRLLLAFFVGNDFVEVRLGGADRFEVDGGLLRDKQVVPTFPLLRRSRLLQLLRALQFRYAPSESPGLGASWDQRMRSFAAIHLRDTADAQFAPAADELARIKQWCEQRGARFSLIVIPRSWQVEPQGLAAMIEALAIDPEELDLDRPQRFLKEWGAERDVEVIDLLPAFRQAVSDEPDLRLYHSPDAHWTAAGHALAAETVAGVLRPSP